MRELVIGSVVRSYSITGLLPNDGALADVRIYICLDNMFLCVKSNHFNQSEHSEHFKVYGITLKLTLLRQVSP